MNNVNILPKRDLRSNSLENVLCVVFMHLRQRFSENKFEIDIFKGPRCRMTLMQERHIIRQANFRQRLIIHTLCHYAF